MPPLPARRAAQLTQLFPNAVAGPSRPSRAVIYVVRRYASARAARISKSPYVEDAPRAPVAQNWSRTQRPELQPRPGSHHELQQQQAVGKYLPEFEALGIKPGIARALKEAFPHVIHPTEGQAKLIPAVLSGKDVLLRDITGSGKSFGILFSLLSRLRKGHPPGARRDRPEVPLETALFIVPHQNLALQLQHWARQLLPLSLFPSLDPVLTLVLRGMKPMIDQASHLRKSPPHIIVGTPTALVELAETDWAALHVPRLKTVVVDEADLLLSIPGKYASRKEERNFQRHPPPTLSLLTALLEERPKHPSPRHPRSSLDPLQMIFMSATLNAITKEWIKMRLQCLAREKEGVVKVDCVNLRKEYRDRMGERVGHWCVVVGEGGRVRDVKTASIELEEGDEVDEAEAEREDAELVEGGDERNPRQRSNSRSRRTEEEEEEEEEESIIYERELYSTPLDANERPIHPPPPSAPQTPYSHLSRSPEPTQPVDPKVELSQAAGSTRPPPSTYPPELYETIAQIFALDVPERAVLFVPPEMSLRRVGEVFEGMGVKARVLELGGGEGGRLLTSSSSITSTAAPTTSASSSSSATEQRAASAAADSSAKADVAAALAETQASEGAEQADEPELLITSFPHARGLDIPNLTHVFILGAPPGMVEYLHMAGRVARRPLPTNSPPVRGSPQRTGEGDGEEKGEREYEGKVITFVKEVLRPEWADQLKYGGGEDQLWGEERKVARIFRGLGIRPGRWGWEEEEE